MIKFVSDFQQVGGFHRRYSPSTPASSTNKTDRHDITEILLKKALNTINQSEADDIITKSLSIEVTPLITVYTE